MVIGVYSMIMNHRVSSSGRTLLGIVPYQGFTLVSVAGSQINLGKWESQSLGTCIAFSSTTEQLVHVLIVLALRGCRQRLTNVKWSRHFVYQYAECTGASSMVSSFWLALIYNTKIFSLCAHFSDVGPQASTPDLLTSNLPGFLLLGS